MSSVVINLYKGQRIDITAQMKDADQILEVFRQNSMHFDKKYTTINGKGPSTITFKGVRAEKVNSDITETISKLQSLAHDDTIGNVYVKISGYFVPKKKTETTAQFEAPKEEDATL